MTAPPGIVIPSELEARVLRVLRDADSAMCGMDLIQVGFHAGSIYNTLRRMDAKGLTDSRWEAPRVFHSLTHQGRVTIKHFDVFVKLLSRELGGP